MEDMQEYSNVSIFDTPEAYGSGKLNVVKAEFVDVQSMSWSELFEGFDRIDAITYSSSIDFICKLLNKFNSAEIIFGFYGVLSYGIHEVLSLQRNITESITKKASKNKLDLYSRIGDGTLSLRAANRQLSHEKLYLLSAEDGRKRVVMGSANMSNAAFSGKQRETWCSFDGNAAYDYYYNSYKQLRDDSSGDISMKCIAAAEGADIYTELPIANTTRVLKAVTVEIDNEALEEIQFALDVSKLAGKIAPFAPKPDKKGITILVPDTFKVLRQKLADADKKEKELRQEFPELVIDAERMAVTLNDVQLDLNPSDGDIKNDVVLFLEYMKGYENFHVHDVQQLQSRYFSFANWFFASPFMAQLRFIAHTYNHKIDPYPVYGILCGQSKAGKSSFLLTLLKMMIGQMPRFPAKEFTSSTVDKLKRAVKGAPIIIDDLMRKRFREHGSETIKNEDFGILDRLINYPAVVISANEDLKSVPQEISRRAVICRVSGGLTNPESMQSNIPKRVQSKIGTAFYREYLRRMFDVFPDMLAALASDHVGAVDIFEASSKILCSIFTDYSDEPLPKYIRCYAFEDYFGDKIIGSNAIIAINRAWTVNRKSFIVDKKLGELRYNTGDKWVASDLVKELSEVLVAQQSGDWIIMNLEKARDFFGINFKRLHFFRI
jgi:hypothetical protein